MIKVFNNFLAAKEAYELSTGLMEIPEHWWSYAVAHEKLDTARYYKNTLRERQRLREAQPNIVDSFLAGSFTYKFKRSTKHTATCNCVECEFRKNTLESEDFKQFIAQETSLKNPQLFESFVSVYEAGDFLSMHTDENRGVAFILNLTAGWRPEYGGMLHVKTDNEIKAIPPVYNSFVLLGLERGKGIPHFVSEVSQYVPNPRIAISGWYNEGS